jgi:hypothetical protein
MVPCSGNDCEACGAAIGAQVRYCFAVAEVTTRRIGLIEMGKSNGLMLQEWSARNGGLRGMMVELRKHTKSPQSRTEILYVDDPAPLWSVGVDAPDPALALYLTWHKAGFKMPAEFRERMKSSLSLKAIP